MSALAYALLDGEERVSWLPERENEGVRYYLSCRKGDKRFRAVSAEPALYQGEVFYITCIGEAGCAFAALQCGAGRHALFCNVPAGALPGGILAGDHAGKGYQGAWHPQALRAAGV